MTKKCKICKIGMCQSFAIPGWFCSNCNKVWTKRNGKWIFMIKEKKQWVVPPKKQSKLKCMMFKDGKCNSDYNKGMACTKKRCPYDSKGSFAMAVKDRKNWVEK